MFQKQTIRDVKLKDKTVLVRVDYNVPLKDGKVVNDLRIRASLPTIKFLLDGGAKKVILISHLGRPDGQRNKDLSLAPIVDSLKQLIPDREVKFINDVSGPDVETAVKNLHKSGILLLENLRFFSGEEKNSEDFIREIVDSTGADIFVQDGFAVIHRAHASTAAIAKCLPVYAGFLLEKEVDSLLKASENPEKPLLLVLGGAKVADKQPLIDNFLDKADKIAVGGKIAADGFSSENPEIYVAEDFDEDAAGNKLDIGPLSTAKIIEVAKQAKTVIWNGVLGKVEDPAFATSSTILAKVLGEDQNITSIICGGDTTGFVENLMAESPELKYSLVSTGGGASLELLCGEKLPGLEVIEDK
ncbi:phosphoglycerate kinase [Candidatus Saccharibacteria bacterium]|nr:phosphoglycerate kinase [Candidatus Saccharibacteria bacterium]